MALVGAVLLLELCARIVVPEVTGEFGGDARVINLALMLWMQGVVVVAAYASLQSDRVMDDVGWLVGLGFVLLHGAWHVGTYDGLYLRGEVMSVVMVLVAYVAMPLSVAVAPVVMASLPSMPGEDEA